MAIYNSIGVSYTNTRNADSRIVDALVDLLAIPVGSVIADIGAGTGNYTNAVADRGYSVWGVEPSHTMRAQSAPHTSVQWLDGTAEKIPLANATVDAVISTLAIHHFLDLKRAMLEMSRVVNGGPILFFTFDYHNVERPWIADYFPSLWDDAVSSLPPLSGLAPMIEQSTGRKAEIVPFPLPPDLTDMFFAAGWQRPEVYLDPAIRAGISSFALGDPVEVESGLVRLANDLNSGLWQERYGWVLNLSELDAGYRFLRAIC